MRLYNICVYMYMYNAPWAGSIRQRVRVYMRGGGLGLFSISLLLLLGRLFILLHSVCDQVVGSARPQAPAHSQPAVLQGKGLGRRLAGDQRLRGRINVLLFTAIPEM